MLLLNRQCNVRVTISFEAIFLCTALVNISSQSERYVDFYYSSKHVRHFNRDVPNCFMVYHDFGINIKAAMKENFKCA